MQTGNRTFSALAATLFAVSANVSSAATNTEPEELAVSSALAIAFAALAIAVAAVAFVFCKKAAKRALEEITKRKRLECIFDNMPFNFGAVDKDGNFLYMHYTNPTMANAKKLREFGGREERAYMRAYREISDTDAKTVKFEFDSPNAGAQRFEASVSVLPEKTFDTPCFLATAVNITERYKNQKLAETLLGQEKIFRIALQMIAQNRGFDEFSGWLLENIAEWLACERITAFKFDDDGKAACLVKFSKTSAPELDFTAGESAKFTAKLRPQNVVVYNAADNASADDFDAVLPSLKAANVKSAMFFGVVDGNDKLVGCLAAESFKDRQKFGEQDRNLMANAAKIVQIALDRRESFRELKESEAQKSLILQTIDNPVILFDKNGKIKSVNNAAAKIIGKGADEIKSCEDLAQICGRTPVDPNCDLHEVLRTKIGKVKQMHIKDRLYEMSYTPVIDNGEISNIVLISTDITHLNEDGSDLPAIAKQSDAETQPAAN